MNRREALAALMSLPAATRISMADLKPDDVIVVEVPGPIRQEAAGMINAHMQRIWPNHKCVVLGDGMKLKVVKG